MGGGGRFGTTAWKWGDGEKLCWRWMVTKDEGWVMGAQVGLMEAVGVGWWGSMFEGGFGGRLGGSNGGELVRAQSGECLKCVGIFGWFEKGDKGVGLVQGR
ncbi:hypothetical protein V6N11_043367 [Hibiscus sabdariffa]|uniref:Uncharacterized protein n=1 Tax=Hibiscus sabdariffa TaxID=183260 RepID=A0ABR2AAN1_9ROSI